MAAKDRRETESNDRSIRRWNLLIFVLIILIALYFYSPSVTDSMKNYTQDRPTQYIQYVDKVKQRYKKHLHGVAQSFWLPADMHKFIQLSLTNREKPHAARVDQHSANQRIVSERSMTFDDLLSEIDASSGSRIVVVGQPGIGKTTLLQRITRSWAHDKALSSCWILLHIVLRDLVLLHHAPNLTTFLSFMGCMNLPPDIETFVLKSDGKGLCFIADGLDEYPAGYEDKTNFILSELIGAQKPNIKLPQSTVVISSRPAVASQVRHLFDKHVEVLGFGDDQINEYIQAKYGEDKSFSLYLDDHPHIKHTCYIPLHLAMLVYIKDYLLDSTDLPETETEIYEQFIIHTLIWDFCSKNPTSSCSQKNTLPTSLNNVVESSEIGILLFHTANLSYIGILKRQSIFTEVEPVLQHTNSSLLVVDKMSVLQPTTYSFPHLTIQEFLAAFYFNTYLSQQEQKRVMVEYSKQQIRYLFWKFCCGLKRNENQTTFLEFFNLLYQNNYGSKQLPYHCAHEAQSLIASQQLLNFTGGIIDINYFLSYYDAASIAFVTVSGAQNLQEIKIWSYTDKFSGFFKHKLCDPHTVYYQLRKVYLYTIDPSNIGCLLQKSPNLESLSVSGWNWNKLQSEDVAVLLLPPYGTKLLNVRHVQLNNLNIGDKGFKKLSQLLQDSIYLETLSLKTNNISDYGASTIADLKALPPLRHLYLDSNHIGDKGVEKLSQDLINLKTLSLNYNGISDKGASAIANLMKALPHLQHVYLHGNNIGGRGAALLWNQSIHKCCSLSLNYNVIDNDRPDVFISALNGTVNNGYEGNKSCQLKVSVVHFGFLCSDLRDILEISKQLPKGVMLINDDQCLNMTIFERILKRLKYYLGKNHPPKEAGFQWVSYVVCTFHIFHSTRTPLWGLLYFCFCLSLFILSSFNYLVQVDVFIFILSLLWSWIVVGRLIFFVSLKLLSKPWGWVLIIAVMVQLYFKLIDYQLFAFLYILLILGYVLFDLGLFPLCYYVGICYSMFYDSLWSHLGYEFIMEVLKIGLH